MSFYYTIGIANIVTVTAFLLIVVSLGTESWTIVTVYRDGPNGLKELGITNVVLNLSLYSKPTYFTRHRGLFKTCFKGSDLKWLDTYQPQDDVVGRCLKEKGYELEQSQQTISFGQAYDERKHLLRSHVAFQVLSFMVLLMGTVGGTLSCYNYSASTLRITGLLVFIGSFFMSGAMAFFHGYEYLEKQKINADGFFKSWRLDVPLRDYSKYEYGFSYVLGWLGTALSFVAAILYLVAANKVINDNRRTKEKLADSRDQRSRAYEYAEQHPVSAYSPPPAPSGYRPSPGAQARPGPTLDYGNYPY